MVRTEREREKKPDLRLFTEQQKEGLFEYLLSEARKEHPSIATDRLERVIKNGINFIDRAERSVARTVSVWENDPVRRLGDGNIALDTGVVYIDSAPGSWKTDEEGRPDDKGDDQYKLYPWSRDMERERVQAGIDLVTVNTAQRLSNKPVEEVTAEDIKEHGPYLQYSATPRENKIIQQRFAEARKAGELKIPPEKVHMYNWTIEKGKFKDIKHTGDQISGFHVPLDESDMPINPRRIVMTTHAAHAFRIASLLEHYKDRIPEGTIIDLFILPMPATLSAKGVKQEMPSELDTAALQYAAMEILGTLTSIFRFREASEKLHPVSFHGVKYELAA